MAQFVEFIKMALMNIRVKKGRSFLTMLGIIIGISSVIMIISIGSGVKGQISDELESMGGGLLYLYMDENRNKENVTFNSSDFEFLMKKVPHLKGVTPVYQSWGNVLGPKGDMEMILVGGTEHLEYQTSDPIVRGKYFTREDAQAGKKVCVITETDAIRLFGTTDVVGMTLEINLWNISQDLRIVGIRKDNEAKLLGAMMQSPYVNVECPINMLGTEFGFFVDDFTSIYLMAESGSYSREVAEKAISLLESRHNIRGEGLIQMESFEDQAGQITSVLDMVTVFIAFVAVISLLVGGIGVMNIMLVSVTERTREIGIRKSLGARTGSIMVQFLAESAVITLLGGVIGIFLGVMGAVGICSAFGFSADVQVSTILIATLFSSGVGIFFGLYPAKKAAKLSPIEALRHE